MIRFILIGFFGFVALTSLIAQRDKMVFGTIPLEDLQMVVYEQDTSASAVVLGDFGDLDLIIKDKFKHYNFSRHKRIKILKRSGFSEGDIIIPHAGAGDLEVMVFAPDGTSFKMSPSDIYSEDLDGTRSIKRFAIPNLQIGTVIDMKYNVYLEGALQIPFWYFQSNLPTIFSEIRTEIPDYLNVVSVIQGLTPTIQEMSEGKEFYTYGSLNHSERVGVATIKNRIAMENIPAMNTAPYITTMRDYYAMVKFQVREIDSYNKMDIGFSKSWDALAEYLEKDEDFGKKISKKRYYKQVLAAVSPLISEKDAIKVKIEKLHTFILDSFYIDSKLGLGVKTDFNKLFELKKAKSNELNLLIVALLKEYGIEACPVLISTRDNGQANTLYPQISQFNYVVCMVFDGEQYILIDFYDKFLPPGYIHQNALNYKGWALMKNGPRWLDIPAQEGSRKLILDLTLADDGSVKGQFGMQLEGYEAIAARREILTGAKELSEIKKFQSRYFDSELSEIKIQNLEDINKPLQINTDISIPNFAMTTSEMMYFAPLIMSGFETNPFVLPYRDYPIQLFYPKKEQIVVHMQLPEGSKIEELPKNFKATLGADAAAFEFLIMPKSENNYQLISKLSISEVQFSKEAYQELKSFFGGIDGKFKEQVVLKK